MTKAKRIFFVMMTDVLGGGEVLTLHLARALRNEVDVTIVCQPNSPLLRSARDSALPTQTLDLGPKLGKKTAFAAAARFLPARKKLTKWFESVPSVNDWCCLQYKWEEILWGGANVPPKVVLAEHGPVPRLVNVVSPVRARLKSAFSSADKVLAWSDPAASSVQDLYNVRATRINAGVDSGRVQQALALRGQRRMHILSVKEADSLLIAYAGRLAHDKGLDDVIRALKLLPSAILVVAGEGEYREALSRLAYESGVIDRVRFLGHLDDPLSTIGAADVTVLLSQSPGEGRPLSVLESTALGTPVLGSQESAAMVALAQEGRVHLLLSREPAEVASRIRELATRDRKPLVTPDWDAVALDFLRTLESA